MINLGSPSQLALILGSFFCEDMALECMRAFDTTASPYFKALSGAALGLHFGHDITPVVLR
jgi:hypothetical protein